MTDTNVLTMTPAGVIEALAFINHIRALFTRLPVAQRRPVYSLPQSLDELAQLIHADFATPQHAVYASYALAGVIADALGTDWSTVEWHFIEGRATASNTARTRWLELAEETALVDDTPGELTWKEHPDAGVRWPPALAQLASLIHA